MSLIAQSICSSRRDTPGSVTCLVDLVDSVVEDLAKPLIEGLDLTNSGVEVTAGRLADLPAVVSNKSVTSPARYGEKRKCLNILKFLMQLAAFCIKLFSVLEIACKAKLNLIPC